MLRAWLRDLLRVSMWLPLGAAAGAPVPVAPGIELIAGRFVPGQQPDGNSVLLTAPQGVIVFDSGRHRDHTQAIVDAVRGRGAALQAVVNSHWHLDHVGGNALLRQAFPGVRVYASAAIDDALHGFLARYRGDLESAIAGEADAARQQAYRDEIALIDAGAALRPDEVITASGTRSLAGLPLQIGLETHAVTAGDVWLYEPKQRVLLAGDLVTLPVPFLDTACPRRWRDALKRLNAVRFRQLVPGHGPVMDRAAFVTWRRAFDGLLACASSAQPKQACVDGWQRDAAPLLRDTDPKFVAGMVDYYVDHSLRAEAKATAPLCGD